MPKAPAVLMLIGDPQRQAAAGESLADLAVRPIAVSCDRAVESIDEYRPICVLLDEAHAATAPDEFLEMAYRHHARLVTLPDVSPSDARVVAALRDAVTPSLAL